MQLAAYIQLGTIIRELPSTVDKEKQMSTTFYLLTSLPLVLAAGAVVLAYREKAKQAHRLR